MRILRKFIGFTVMYWGIAWWAGGAAGFAMLYDDPGFTAWKKVGVILLAGILGFVFFYTGRWIWKDDKKPKPGTAQVVDLAAGGPGAGAGPSGTAFNGVTIHTASLGATDPKLAKELNELFGEMSDLFDKTFRQPGVTAHGRTAPFNTPSAPGASGESAASNEPVTINCPGCGAPVTVSPSSPAECEYCGNKVQYKRPG